jgi:hypothetical protein
MQTRQKRIRRAIAWGVMCIALGVRLCLEGSAARKNGRIIPATTKQGPMTGTHAVVAGVVCLGFGVAWLLTLLPWRAKQDEADSDHNPPA